ncbi:MAG TPA: ABC transporter permease [Humisphaera sp.]|jgi:phospholipid/cholesterol/gamma-HCH transport system permease protein|nr:ABC transporter permease [Humisphaera sp.]
MPLTLVEKIGSRANNILASLGDFVLFVARTFGWIARGGLGWKNLRLLFPQMFEVGARSVPVVGVTGAFIGMVMAVETVNQFKAIGQENRIGALINLSVVKQIGPVLAAVMLAGRVGGALAAELGTMNVTEQLDALRVMGADPIRYLVVPRFLATLLLTPVLTIYSDALGIIGGWFISVFLLGIPNEPYWQFSHVEMWQIMEGLLKSIFFGGSIGLISCYKGFNSGSGASGVGRACTESFVASFLVIIMQNFVFAEISKQAYVALYGIKGIF